MILLPTWLRMAERAAERPSFIARLPAPGNAMLIAMLPTENNAIPKLPSADFISFLNSAATAASRSKFSLLDDAWLLQICFAFAEHARSGKMGRCSSRCQPGFTPESSSSELVTYTHCQSELSSKFGLRTLSQPLASTPSPQPLW